MRDELSKELKNLVYITDAKPAKNESSLELKKLLNDVSEEVPQIDYKITGQGKSNISLRITSRI